MVIPMVIKVIIKNGAISVWTFLYISNVMVI